MLQLNLYQLMFLLCMNKVINDMINQLIYGINSYILDKGIEKAKMYIFGKNRSDRYADDLDELLKMQRKLLLVMNEIEGKLDKKEIEMTNMNNEPGNINEYKDNNYDCHIPHYIDNYINDYIVYNETDENVLSETNNIFETCNNITRDISDDMTDEYLIIE